ncbi:uncharacterized protein UHO2_02943 [Ustilago hordei]|uniref:Related to UDP-glucose:glycoprotein glucosyltransferase n=1 Tax=Ustilago hordei TaxID=120017 RepID=I2G3B3_USTHO|nr:uncharacterized protein UHO2_02943 [Ustilago hordei]CCF53656.1 related to UDP-glucose:glycoprotein glucosyltransferase precursor [Ustilago hordei]SYW78931.1 related to UDP-glucose:glycoprotein glucosyltransferase precursor [Ustilago hordei]
MRALTLLSVGWAWLALALTLTSAAHLARADSPPAKVQLRASWLKIRLPSNGSPFLLELLEAARSQRPSSFFPLIDLLTSTHTATQLRSASDKWLAQTIENLIRSHQLFGTSQTHVDEALDTWRMSLALKNSTPRIQAFVHLYKALQLEDTWRSRSNKDPCVSWVHHEGKVLCSAEELHQALQDNAASSSAVSSTKQVAFGHPRSASEASYKFDTASSQIFELYADPYSDNFRELFSTLEKHATDAEGGVKYTLRWRPSLDNQPTATSGSQQTTFLSGYGAILDLKKVDYLVIDDRKLKDDSDIGDLGIATNTHDEEAAASQRASADLRWLQDQIGADSFLASTSLSSLTDSEIADLGIKAARLIMSSPDPLRALQELSQNFPSHAAALASSTKFDDGDASAALFEAVLGLSSMRIEPGASDLWLNGKRTPAKEFMPLTLLETLKQERNWSHALQHRLAGGGLNVTEAGDLIASSLVGRAFLAQAEGEGAAAIFDASDRIELKNAPEGTVQGAITWLNDLETDEATKAWSSDLMDLLRPMWPGKFPRLSLNLFNVVLVLDLRQRESCRFLSDTVIQSLGRVGLHWGLVPGGLEDDANSDSIRMARLFWFLLEEASPQVLSDVLRKTAASRAGTADTLDVSLAIKEAKFALKAVDSDETLSSKLDSILAGQDPAYTVREELSKAYINRLRATRQESPTGHVFVNGQHQPFHPQIVHILHQSIQEQIQLLAPQIYYGQLSSLSPGLSTFFYDSVGALSFRSALVPGAGSAADGEEEGVRHEAVDLFSVLVDDDVPSATSEGLFNFFYPSSGSSSSEGEEKPAALLNSTVWVLADLDSQGGLDLLTRTFEALAKEDAKFRLGVVHAPSPASQRSNREVAISTAFHRFLTDSQSSRPSPALIHDALRQPEQLRSALGLSQSSIDSDQAAFRFWNSIALPITAKLDLATPALIVDGHLVSNFDSSTVEARDITALVEYEADQKLPYITQALTLLREDVDSVDPVQRQNLVFASLSVMNGVYDSRRQNAFSSKLASRSGLPEQLGTADHIFEVGDKANADIRITLLLNPLSESAQRWSSILLMLRELEGVYLRVILNPEIKLRELPLKRFYRFSAPHRLQFDLAGKVLSEELQFFNMPEEAVLTMGLDAPAPWLTMPVEAVYDLDNIRLSDVPSSSRGKGVKAVYELKHILIEGHAREKSANSLQVGVPRGLQLLLETPDGSTSLDTIVMANLAYFQFKAQPGLWKLRIRAGRSDELYEMQSVGSAGWDSPSVGVKGDLVTLDTFSGLTIYPRVSKRKGKETEQLLEELDAQGRPVKKTRTASQSTVDGVAVSASNFLSSAKDKITSLANQITSSNPGASNAVATRKHADINIFTVASGHLYERMTYIMILSVLKHTNSSVKFWFIENFLSPSFKEFIPHFAKEYGFEYELVTYAWPHWLRAQREKQRTIWGYKILFLDTLFPLDLSKVIFVDADQVVRTDLKELVDLDLQGKVYGYPPMGDDSEDMDGFRFWKQGYWKDYLRGRPYHISALYVVDLNRFRLFAAGDRLRGQYQALSADPNSLSNLDQDLPNNMQASLPIFTLDKEWLWCETWCSNDWLDKAKTIDLCSNPKTKEPKLNRAKRQIPEWTVYDQEVARLAQRLVEEKVVGKSVVAPESQMEKKQPQEASGLMANDDGTPVHDEL